MSACFLEACVVFVFICALIRIKRYRQTVRLINKCFHGSQHSSQHVNASTWFAAIMKTTCWINQLFSFITPGSSVCQASLDANTAQMSTCNRPKPLSIAVPQHQFQKSGICERSVAKLNAQCWQGVLNVAYNIVIRTPMFSPIWQAAIMSTPAGCNFVSSNQTCAS